MNLNLSGKVVIITGTRRGIGRASHTRSSPKACAWLAAGSKDQIEETADSLATERLVQAVDLRMPEAAASLVEAATSRFRGNLP